MAGIGISTVSLSPANTQNDSSINLIFQAIQSTLIPSIDNFYNLGSFIKSWLAVYAYSFVIKIGLFSTTIISAALSASQTISIPNSGATSASFILSTSSSGQTIAGGLTVTGSFSLTSSFNVSGASSGILQFGVSNTTNSASAGALSYVTVAGTSATGNPIFAWIVNAVQSYCSGINNSASQVWQLCSGAVLGTNVAMQMSTGGILTFPNQPSVLASKSADVSAADSGDGTLVSPVIFDNINNQTGSGYNASTGIYTCPIAGRYRVTGSLLVRSIIANNSSIAIQLNINNGSALIELYNIGMSNMPSGTLVPWGAVTYKAAFNDTLRIQYSVSGNATKNTKTGGDANLGTKICIDFEG
jgi:hypothetical protein